MPPNGPELSCGDVPLDYRRMLVRQVMCLHLVNSFARGEIADSYFRQLERLVSQRQSN